MECLRPLEKCLSNARSVAKVLTDHLSSQPQVDKTGGEIVTVSLTFACKSLEAIVSELKYKRVVQAAILVRPVYEQSIRVLWACSEQGRWDRLCSNWLQGEIKWAGDAKESTPKLRQQAFDCLQECKCLLARIPAQGDVPKIDCMLRQLSHHGLNSCDATTTKFYYQCYRELSQFAHGNYRWIGGHVRFAAIAQHVVILAIWSVCALMMAAHWLIGCDYSRHFESAARLIQQCDRNKFRCFEA